jgi:lysylphosphatidylglycerol synthetase-like protein (DUF2156 family)
MLTAQVPSSLNRDTIVNLVRRYATAATDAVLDPETLIFHVDYIEGLIGYRLEKECVVVYGDPICAQADRESLTEAFHKFCKEKNKSIVYLIVSDHFAEFALEKCYGAIVEYGEELYIDPFNDPTKNVGVNAQLVRRKCRRAEKENVAVVEYTEKNSELEQQMNLVSKKWLEARNGPQIHISNIFLFDDVKGKRWFYAKQNEKIVGLVVLNRLEESQGWLINHLMITPDCPSGTSELLIISALNVLREENCHYVTFGNVPAQNITNIVGLSSFKAAIVKMLFSLSKKFFRLDSKKMFWAKFNPESKKSYLLFEGGHVGLKELRGLVKALNIKI